MVAGDGSSSSTLTKPLVNGNHDSSSDKPAQQPYSPELKKFKWLYLAFYVAVAAYIPFVPIYFKQNGLPASSIGILTSLNPIVSIFGGPIAGLAADRTGRPRLILMLLIIVSSLFRLSLAAIVELSDDANDVFGVIFVAVLFGELCGAPINALIDAGALAHIKVLGLATDEHYGKQRLWGAVGWGLAAVGVGAVVENAPTDWRFSGTDMCFVLFAGLQMITLVVTRAMPMNPSDVAKVRVRLQAQKQQADLQGLIVAANAQHHAANEVPTRVILPPPKIGGMIMKSSSTSSTHSLNGSASTDSLKDISLQHTTEYEEGSIHDIIRSTSNISGVVSTHSQASLVSHSSNGHHHHTNGHTNGHSNNGGDPLLAMLPTSPATTRAHIANSIKGDATRDETVTDEDVKEEMALDQFGRPLSVCASLKRALTVIVTNADAAKFFIIVISMGIMYGLISGYLFLYLESLGASATLMGLSLTVTCIAEVPIFHYSGKMIEKLGAMGVLYVVLGAYAVRCFSYSMLTREMPWAVLPIELLHGVTFGAAWAASTTLAARIAPRGLGTTMQGLLAAAHWGIGNGGGNILGGFIYDRYGPVKLFRYAGVGVTGGIGILGLLKVMSYICRRRKKSNSGASDQHQHPLLNINDGDSAAMPSSASSISSPSFSNSMGYQPPGTLNTLN